MHDVPATSPRGRSPRTAAGQTDPADHERSRTDPADHEAFTRLVTPELDVLYRVARTLVHRPAAAEDLVQDTLVRAYRAIGTFDGSHPRAWLLTIMRNTEINRNRRRRPVLLHDADMVRGVSDPGTEGQPEESLVGGAFERAVVRAVAALPERHAQVMTLVDIDGLRYAEAAEALGVPIGTVMSRLHRARAQVRRRLTAEGLAPRGGTS